MYIEPCCADKQLAALLHKAFPNAVMFQTAGDLTLDHLMKATFLLVGTRPRTLTISVPVFTEEMNRAVSAFLRAGWIASFRLLTATPVEFETGAESCAIADSAPSVLFFSGLTHTIVIQGPIFDAVTPGLHLYSALYGRSDSPLLRSYLDPFNAFFKAHLSATSAASPSSTASASITTSAPSTTSPASTASTPSASSPVPSVAAVQQPSSRKPRNSRKKPAANEESN